MRTIVVDRWPVLRHGLALVLRHAGHDVVRAVPRGDEGLRLLGCRRDVETVVLGSTERPAPDLVRAVRRVERPTGPVRVVALVDEPSPALLDELATARADRVLDRCSEHSDVVGALDAVALDAVGLDRARLDRWPPTAPDAAPRPADAGAADPSAAERDLPILTVGERELLAWLGRGLSRRDVATRLFVSQVTLEAQEAALHQKLGVASSEEAVARALTLDLLDGAVTWSGGAEAVSRAG